MGMLDDAIREHLELKRLRGADPGEVAREQREALDPPAETAQPEHDSDFPNVGQETAELDMRAVLEEDPDAADGASSVESIGGDSAAAGYAADTPAEESLDWGFPDDRDRKIVAEDVPGQERFSFE